MLSLGTGSLDLGFLQRKAYESKKKAGGERKEREEKEKEKQKVR